MEIIRWIAIFVGMGTNCISDLLNKKVLPIITIAVSILGVIWQISQLEKNPINILLGVMIGVIILIFSKITGGAIGEGDGLVLIMSGIWLGGTRNFLLCSTAMILAGIWAMILFVLFHKKKNYEIPFVPFLFLGLIWVRCME